MSKRKKSKVVAAPAIIGMRRVQSRALRAGKSQVVAANEFAQSIGCGTPFRKEDGIFDTDENVRNRFMREVNKRREDLGEERFVNFDGGYREET